MLAVLAFALSMIIGSAYGSYLASIFIALSFIPMICSFVYYSNTDRKVAGYSAIAFAAVYGVFIFIVYFAQLTAVINDELNPQALQIIDYRNFGLFFSYDLFGYSIMALTTFFAGLTIEANTKVNKWLKWLLLIHGIFFFIAIIPMLGVFNANVEGADWIGIAILEFWCAYFIPVGILSYFNFKNK
jgi:hypothetical protein